MIESAHGMTNRAFGRRRRWIAHIQRRYTARVVGYPESVSLEGHSSWSSQAFETGQSILHAAQQDRAGGVRHIHQRNSGVQRATDGQKIARKSQAEGASE